MIKEAKRVLICDRCGEPAFDIFPSAYDGEGNPIDEEALCWSCFADDIREQNQAEDAEEDESSLMT